MALPFNEPKIARNPLYIHPRILSVLESIIDHVDHQSSGTITAKVISTHRSPEEQFELFKKGRVFRNGSWIRVPNRPHVTNIDGFSRLSRHNYLPCLACDFGLFRGATFLTDDADYDMIGPPARAAGLNWGGDWTRFVDKPHVQLDQNQMFKKSFIKDVALQWQRYLKISGVYKGQMDGIFGNVSRAALLEATGIDTRTPQAWEILFRKFGQLPGENF